MKINYKNLVEKGACYKGLESFSEKYGTKDDIDVVDVIFNLLIENQYGWLYWLEKENLIHFDTEKDVKMNKINLRDVDLRGTNFKKLLSNNLLTTPYDVMFVENFKSIIIGL